MEVFWSDLKYALRMLRRSPGFAAVGVLTLALGIGANAAIFSVVNGVLLRPVPYADAERLMVVAETDPEDEKPTTTSFGTMEEWKARSRSFKSLALHRSWAPTLLVSGATERLVGRRVSANFFGTLGVRPAIGRDFTPEEDHPDNWRVVMLSHSLWQRGFGEDESIAGKPISLGGTPYTVVGVLPPDFRPVFFANRAEQVDIWAPLGYAATQSFACRSCRHLRAIGRLNSGVSVEQATSEMNAIEASLKQEFSNDYGTELSVAVVPIKEALTGEVRPALLALIGAVAFVLLISCSNVANLLLARATQRQKEMAIRAALGAGRWRLLRQGLTESTLIAVLGGASGIVLALWGTEVLLALGPDDLPRLDEVGVDGRALMIALGLSLLTGLLVGLPHALQASRAAVSEALREGGRTSTAGGHRLRRAFVVAEMALALILIAGAGLLLKSFANLLNVQPGFKASDVLTFTTYASGPRYSEPAQSSEHYRQVEERLRALPGVEAVAFATPLPLSGSFDRAGLHVEGRPLANEADAPGVDRYLISGDYLRAMSIPLLRGRAFTEQEVASDAPVALVSQLMAQVHFPDGEAIGQRIKLGGSGPDNPWRTIVGVVGDVRQYGLAMAPTAQTYLPSVFSPGYIISGVVRAKGAASLGEAVKREIWAIDKERPVYRIAPLESIVGESVAQPRFTLFLVGLFALLALVLAAVGIYGVISYLVSQRTREIGVRMALGAGRRDILRLVLGEGLLLIAGGVLLGTAGALSVTHLLASQLYGVSSRDPMTFVWVGAVLAFVALLACYVPARRAARVEPMVALRYE